MTKTPIKAFGISFLLLCAPRLAFAVIPTKVLTLMGNIYQVILNPLIALMFAVAFLYFMYGIVNFVWNGENADVREKGRKGMLWGIAGMFIMFSVFGIIRILVSTIGVDDTTALSTV